MENFQDLESPENDVGHGKSWDLLGFDVHGSFLFQIKIDTLDIVWSCKVANYINQI